MLCQESYPGIPHCFMHFFLYKGRQLLNVSRLHFSSTHPRQISRWNKHPAWTVPCRIGWKTPIFFQRTELSRKKTLPLSSSHAAATQVGTDITPSHKRPRAILTSSTAPPLAEKQWQCHPEWPACTQEWSGLPLKLYGPVGSTGHVTKTHTSF